MNIVRKFELKATDLKIGGIICCILTRYWLYILYFNYKFDQWHATAPACC